MKASIALIVLLTIPFMDATAHTKQVMDTTAPTKQNYTAGSTQYVNARNGLSLRARPAKNSHRILVARYGYPVILLSTLLTNKPITERGIRGYWIKVEYQGKSGFMFSGYLINQGDKKLVKRQITSSKLAKISTRKKTSRKKRVRKNRRRKRRLSKRQKIEANRVSTQVNTKCYNTPKNYIIGQAQKNGAGTLVLVKYKSYTNDKIACKYVKHDEDFVIRLGKTENIHGAKGDFLILNQASSAGARDLTVWNLAERKIAYTGAYRKMITMTPEHLVFWRATKKVASIDQCPSLSKQKWEGGAVMATKVRLHLSDAKLNFSNETRCFRKN